MRPARVHLSGAIVLILAGCSWVGLGGRCVDAAAEFGEGFTVAAAFTTTVGAVRDFQPSSLELVAGWDDSQDAMICYLDGPFPKAPPPHDGVRPRSADRGIVLVVDDSAIPLVLGYQERITIRDPNTVP